MVERGAWRKGRDRCYEIKKNGQKRERKGKGSDREWKGGKEKGEGKMERDND